MNRWPVQTCDEPVEDDFYDYDDLLRPWLGDRAPPLPRFPPFGLQLTAMNPSTARNFYHVHADDWQFHGHHTLVENDRVISAANLQPNDTVLVIGTGHGEVVIEAARAARFVIGIDHSFRMVEIANARIAQAHRADARCIAADTNDVLSMQTALFQFFERYPGIMRSDTLPQSTLRRRFNVILIPFAFEFLELHNQAQYLTMIRTHLIHSQGRVILQYPNTHRLVASLEAVVERSKPGLPPQISSEHRRKVEHHTRARCELRKCARASGWNFRFVEYLPYRLDYDARYLELSPKIKQAAQEMFPDVPKISFVERDAAISILQPKMIENLRESGKLANVNNRGQFVRAVAKYKIATGLAVLSLDDSTLT